jgi:integrase
MASLHRKTVTRSLPASAKIEQRKGGLVAVWRGRDGRKKAAPLVLGDDGTPKLGADGKPRIRERSSTVYAKVSGVGDAVPTGCRTTDGARYRLGELIQRSEHRRAGVLSEAELRIADHQASPLPKHLGAYDAHLEAKGCTAAHRANVRGRLRRLCDDCGFTRLPDLDRDAVERWLVERRTAGMSARTRNAYGAAIVSFGNWCVESHRLVVNPFHRLTKANEAADPRRQRRALAADELTRLVAVAQRRPLADFGREAIERPDVQARPKRTAEDRARRDTWYAAPLTPRTIDQAEAAALERLKDNPGFVAKLRRRGRERALTYKVLALTGLRLAEARSLRVRSLDLGDNPYAMLMAADAKTGEAAEIPLRADLAADLRRHLAERLEAAQRAALRERRPVPARLDDEERVLHAPPGLVKALDRDLVAAGLATIERLTDGRRRVVKRDNRGRSFDVHGFRHTFNSLLAAAGVPLRTRQVLMRHRSGTLTDDVYSDRQLLDLRGALDKLPALPLDDRPDAERLSATGTDSSVAPSVAPDSGGTGDAERPTVGHSRLDDDDIASAEAIVSVDGVGTSDPASVRVVNRGDRIRTCDLLHPMQTR